MATYTVTDGQSQTLSFTPTSRNGQADQVNVSGAASLDATVTSAPASESLTVDLASNAHLTAGFHFTGQNTLTVHGDASTSVTFAGTNDFAAAASAYIQPDVLGTATLNVGPDGELDLARSVADGVTVNLNGNAGSPAILVQEQPGAFKGAVNFSDGLVVLRGDPQPASYDLSNGVLTIYGGNHGQMLNTLRFVDASPEKAGLAVTFFNGQVEIAEKGSSVANGADFQAGGALTQHVAPVVPQPASSPYVAAHDNTTGADLPDTSSAYSGPVGGVQNQFINITPDNLNVAAKADNLFIKTGAGDDAVALHGGTNVVDAGTGSNFLTSGGGFDTFFLDARNIPAAASAAGPVPGAIWDTVQGFGHGDAVTLWGIGSGTALAWQKNEGAVGHTGLTLHAITPNGATTSLTLAGVDNTSHLALSYGQTGGASYLYVKAT